MSKIIEKLREVKDVAELTRKLRQEEPNDISDLVYVLSLERTTTAQDRKLLSAAKIVQRENNIKKVSALHRGSSELGLDDAAISLKVNALLRLGSACDKAFANTVKTRVEQLYEEMFKTIGTGMCCYIRYFDSPTKAGICYDTVDSNHVFCSTHAPKARKDPERYAYALEKSAAFAKTQKSVERKFSEKLTPGSDERSAERASPSHGADAPDSPELYSKKEKRAKKDTVIEILDDGDEPLPSMVMKKEKDSEVLEMMRAMQAQMEQINIRMADVSAENRALKSELEQERKKNKMVVDEQDDNYDDVSDYEEYDDAIEEGEYREPNYRSFRYCNLATVYPLLNEKLATDEDKIGFLNQFTMDRQSILAKDIHTKHGSVCTFYGLTPKPRANDHIQSFAVKTVHRNKVLNKSLRYPVCLQHDSTSKGRAVMVPVLLKDLEEEWDPETGEWVLTSL